MQTIPFCNGRLSGQLLTYEYQGEGLFAMWNPPPGLPTHLRIAPVQSSKIAVSHCLETSAGTLVSGLLPILGTVLFAADIRNGIGERSMLTVRLNRDWLSLDILFIDRVPSVFWGRAKTESRQYFTGKKKPSFRRAKPNTERHKRGFGNCSD